MDLVCSSPDEIVVRTKLVRDSRSAAMCIAESVSHSVLRALELPAAEAFSVSISRDFAQDLTSQFGFSQAILPGRHWGTKFISNTMAYDDDTCDLSDLLEPFDLFRLFVFDVLLANSDRTTYGNTLMLAQKMGFSLLSIDHSESFFHPATLVAKGCLLAKKKQTGANWLKRTESVVMDSGMTPIDDFFLKVDEIVPQVNQFVETPPDEWYDKAQVNPGTVAAFLKYRFDNIRTLAKRDHWEGLINFGGANDDLVLKL